MNYIKKNNKQDCGFYVLETIKNAFSSTLKIKKVFIQNLEKNIIKAN